jgi:hypothetical protein
VLRIVFPAGVTPLVIKRINEDSLASEFPELRDGLELTHIQGELASKWTYKQALAKMKSVRRTVRPLCLTFIQPVYKERENKDVWSGAVKSRFDESSSSSDSDDDDDAQSYVPQSRRR